MAKEIKAMVLRLRVSKWAAFLLVLFLTACDNTVYHMYCSVDDGVWTGADTLQYRFYPSAGKGLYDYRLGVRTTAAYPYSTLAMRVEATALGDSIPLFVDTVICMVYGDNGRREGSSVGLLYQVESKTEQGLFLNGDTVHFKVLHLMDADTLYGVSDVGLKIMSSKE